MGIFSALIGGGKAAARAVLPLPNHFRQTQPQGTPQLPPEVAAQLPQGFDPSMMGPHSPQFKGLAQTLAPQTFQGASLADVLQHAASWKQNLPMMASGQMPGMFAPPVTYGQQAPQPMPYGGGQPTPMPQAMDDPYQPYTPPMAQGGTLSSILQRGRSAV